MRVGLLVSEGEVKDGGVCAGLPWRDECLARGWLYRHYFAVGGARFAVVHFDQPFCFNIIGGASLFLTFSNFLHREKKTGHFF